MKKVISETIIFIASLSLIGVLVLNLYLPPMPSGALAGWLIEFVLIFLGLVTTLLMGNVFPSITPQIFVVLLGLLALVLFMYGFKVKSKALRCISILFWVMVGTWSTFWGLVYGI